MSKLTFKLTPDPWLATVMARPVHRVSVDPNGAAVRDALGEPKGFYYARVPTDDVATVRALIEVGFYVVDKSITLECDPASAAETEISARLAEPGDRDAVVDIARDGFQYSRFHLDPAIPKALANEIKAQWAGNFFSGRRGDHMVVAEGDGKVVGFAQLLRAADGALVIDLIAVDAAARGSGRGRAMCRRAAQLAAGRLRVGTQAANVPSLRLYESVGFRAVSSDFVLHLHA